jgi:hypothetical protein
MIEDDENKTLQQRALDGNKQKLNVQRFAFRHLLIRMQC